MMRRNFHCKAILLGACLIAPAVTENSTAIGQGFGTRTGTGTAAAGVTAPVPGAALDVDTAFSAVERGDTIGATGSTGAGFSALSVAPNAAGGGIGGAGGFGGFGGLGGFGGFGGANGFGGTGAANNEPAIRTRLRSAIEVAPTAPAIIQARANLNLYRAPDRAGVDNVNVYVQDGTAVVTGTVTNDRDRRMSELLMRLEPGVRRVDNRVIVSP